MVFSISHLHNIRDWEVREVAHFIPHGAVVLEIGAGTGVQAKILSDLGFEVHAVDVAQSSYVANRVFPVIDYDGLTLPMQSGTIDVVFSSNVLEHVRDLRSMHLEIKRVLKPNGFCLHLMPSSSWRLWTTISGWMDIGPALHVRFSSSPSLERRGKSNGALDAAKIIASRLIPRRHGEHGFALSELWTFSRGSWCRHFVSEYFDVEIAKPMGLFYTGNMLFGKRLSIGGRRQIARWLGSACNFYKVRPAAQDNNRRVQGPDHLRNEEAQFAIFTSNDGLSNEGNVGGVNTQT